MHAQIIAAPAPRSGAQSTCLATAKRFRGRREASLAWRPPPAAPLLPIGDGDGCCGAGRPAWRASSGCPSPSARSSSSGRCHRSTRRGRSSAGARLPLRVGGDAARAGCRDRRPGRCRSRRRARRARAAVLSGIGARSSIVRYDRQRVESSTPGSTSAPVGHASRHRVQLPHCSSPCVSGSSASVQMISAQEQPRTELGIDQAGVLADPAEPGVLRVHPLLHRAGVHVGARVERLGRRRRASTPAARRAAASGRRGSRRPRRSGRCGRRPRAGSVGVRPVGVVERAGDDDAARAAARRRGRRRGARPCAPSRPSRRRTRGRATRAGTRARESRRPARCRTGRSPARRPARFDRLRRRSRNLSPLGVGPN